MEGEDRFAWSEAACEPRWGDSLSAEAVPERRDHPPRSRFRAIGPRASSARLAPSREGKKAAQQAPNYLNPEFPGSGTSS
ncbi:hypothetical protein BJA01nite_35180 [Bradyrhizobium japonicum]|nr:hypothetical protein BJ6T_19110 [Bradyrhizobium japonicum USDA 6]GEC45876.1 hypothetical protein BJA01nite_35180 [Bradyrhizobium japonicum]